MLLVAVTACDYVYSLDRPPPDAPSCPEFPVTRWRASSLGIAGSDPTVDSSQTRMFVTSQNDLFTLDRTGGVWGSPRRVLSGANVEETSPAFVPDNDLEILFAKQSAAVVSRASMATGAWVDEGYLNGFAPRPDDHRPGPRTSAAPHRIVVSYRFEQDAYMDLESYDLVELEERDDDLGWVRVTPPTLESINIAGVGDREPHLSADGCWLLFASNRDGAYRLYASTRPAPNTPFAAPIPIEIEPAGVDTGPWLSLDGRSLYFARGPLGMEEVWIATLEP